MKRNIFISAILALTFYICIRLNIVAFDENSLLTIVTIFLALVAIFESIRLFDYNRNSDVRGTYYVSKLFTLSVMLVNLFILYVINKDEMYDLLWIIDYVVIGFLSLVFSLNFIVRLAFNKDVI